MANEKRLIDANDFYYDTVCVAAADVCEIDFNENYTFGFTREAIKDMLDDCPTVEAVEVVHGRWDDNGRCTICGRYMPFDCEGNAYESIYCPDCGTKMDGEYDG